MVNKKAVFICTIIAVIIVAIIVAIEIKEFKKVNYNEHEINENIQNSVNEQNIMENRIENEVGEQTNEINTVNVQNEVSNSVQNNEIQGAEELPSEQTNSNEQSKEKAIRLVKEEWGEDDTVYYTIDNQSGEIFTISVRSKINTATLAEYQVNVIDETVMVI